MERNNIPYKMKKEYKVDIEHKDSKGFYHGYQEYYSDNKLWLRKKSRHGFNFGYVEIHRHQKTFFYIR